MKEGLLVGKVRSSNGQKFYEIRKIRVGEWHCGCKAWEFTRPNKTCNCKAFQFTRPDAKGRKFPCKHQRSLWQAWRDLTAREALEAGIRFSAKAAAALAR